MYKKIIILVLSNLLISTYVCADVKNEDKPDRFLFSRRPLISAFSLSPNDINQQLDDLDDKKHPLIEQTPLTPYFSSWRAFNQHMTKKTGLNLGLAYTSLIQSVVKDTYSPSAASGDFDFFGHWNLDKSEINERLIGFLIEQRHKYTAYPPSKLNEIIDSTFKTTSGFNVQNIKLNELWWEQHLLDHNFGYRIGRIDIMSMMNNFAFDGQNFFFLNNMITSHPAVAAPDNGLGLVISKHFNNYLYVSGGITNANNGTKDSEFNEMTKGEFYKAVEFGYRNKSQGKFSNRFHVYLWHLDQSIKNNTPSDYGFSIVLQKQIRAKVTSFIKVDANQGRMTEFKKLFLAGLGFEKPYQQNYAFLGMAVGVGQPSNKLAGNEAIFETFYRVQLTHFVQLTPDLQIINFKPAHQNRKWGAVFSLRLRVAG